MAPTGPRGRRPNTASHLSAAKPRPATAVRREAARRGAAASPHGGRTGWGLASSIGLLLAVIAPLILSRPTLESLSHPPVVLALAITWYAAGRLWLLLMAGTNRPISLTFWLFVYVFFGLAGLANTVSQQFPLLRVTYDEGTQVAAQLTILVGLAGYELGSLLARGRLAQERWTRRLNLPTVSVARVRMIGVVGIVAVAYFTFKYGLGTRFSSRQTATEAFLGPGDGRGRLFQRENKGGGLLRLALDGIPVYVALYLTLSQRWVQQAHARTSGRVTRSGLVTRMLLIALALSVFLADNPISTSRSRFLGVSIALLLAVWPLLTARRFRIFAVILVTGTLFVYPYAAVFRTQQRDQQIVSLNTQFRTSPDFAMFQQEVNAQKYVESYGHTGGRQFLGVVFAFVPKKFWPDKPGTTGSLIFPQAADLLPTSVTLWGWAFVDGGMLWVFIFFAVYGSATAALEGAYRRRPLDRLSFAAAAVPLCAASQILLLRGDPQPAMGELLPIMVALIAACSVGCRVRRPSGRLVLAPQSLDLPAGKPAPVGFSRGHTSGRVPGARTPEPSRPVVT